MTSAVKSAIKDLKGRLDEKVCIVTGGGSGIGYEASVLFAQQGAHVIVADINIEAAKACVERIKDITGPLRLTKVAIAVECDVSVEEQVKACVDRALKEWGRLDVMFNNAGVMLPNDDDATNTDENVWDQTMNVNVKGVWYGCKHAIAAFKKCGRHGSIINTASFVALMGSATSSLAYATSKGAVLALTRELAVRHAREGIRVNALCPGPLKTPLLMNFLNTEEKKQRRLVHVPVGRFGEAIEQAYAALFLASDESSFVTGTDFKVDGGLTAAYVTPEGPAVSVPPKPFFKGDRKLEKK